MKCEECLPLLEEFCDGEVDRQTGELMGAHMAACAECAEAFAALGAEQELYMRYDRELEVPPAMWHAVRERIAEAQPVRASKPLPLLLRLREQFALFVGALAVRPALASSMALLLVGVAAGALWLAQAPRPVNRQTIAQESAGQQTAGQQTELPSRRAEPNPTATPDHDANDKEVLAQTITPEVSRGRVAYVETAGLTKVSFKAERRLPNPVGAGDVVLNAEHVGREDDVLPVQASLLDDDVLSINTRLLDPEEKEVARHVEHAQMLLRSFRNARDTEGEGVVNIAYEKNLSRKLLDENISLQLEAESAGNKTTARILNSLEPFLLDISNLRDEPSRDEVRSIKERMQKKEIIASLQVY
jgi:anti-sigma factor RsiW